MGYDNQVWHDEVRKFSEKILERLNIKDFGEAHDSHGEVQSSCDWKGSSQSDGGLASEGLSRYSIDAEDERSCVVALVRDGVEMGINRV